MPLSCRIYERSAVQPAAAKLSTEHHWARANFQDRHPKLTIVASCYPGDMRWGASSRLNSFSRAGQRFLGNLPAGFAAGLGGDFFEPTAAAFFTLAEVALAPTLFAGCALATGLRGAFEEALAGALASFLTGALAVFFAGALAAGACLASLPAAPGLATAGTEACFTAALRFAFSGSALCGGAETFF